MGGWNEGEIKVRSVLEEIPGRADTVEENQHPPSRGSLWVPEGKEGRLQCCSAIYSESTY